MVEPFCRAYLNLSYMMVKRTRYQDADQRGQNGDRRIARDDDNRMRANAGDGRVPDVTPSDQASALARHAAIEKAEILADRSSSLGVFAA